MGRFSLVLGSVKRTHWILIGILFVGLILRIVNLGSPDMIEDDALYSVRAVEYFDYAGSLNTQTTPVVWFPESQWWQYLSFHDAPPLVFALQWIFFQIGGDSQWVARIPFVIVGILSIAFLYLLGTQVANTWVGLFAAAGLALMNYHVWVSRIGLLDGVVILWVILSLYFFIRAPAHPKNYLWWGITIGAGLLTKYTFLFMGPLFLVAFLVWQRSAWRTRWFWIGLAACMIVISPIVMYNTMVWKTRGHFDAALSTMAGLSPNDFQGLSRKVNTDLGNVSSVVKGVAGGMSPGVWVVLFLGVLVFLYLAIIRRNYRVSGYLLASGIVFAVIFLTLAGGSGHYSVVLLPFLLLSASLVAWRLWSGAKRPWRVVLVGCAGFVVLWELFFTVQNQLLPQPLITHALFVDPVRPRWLGYSALEDYVEGFYRKYSDPSYIVFSKTPQIFARQVRTIKSFYEGEVERPQQTHLLVYDDRMDWFGGLWIFERRRLYDVAAIPSLTNFVDAIEGNYIYKFVEFGFQDVTVIVATERVPYNQAIDVDRLTKFARRLGEVYNPVHEIRNPQGEVAFQVFELPLDETLQVLAQDTQ